MKILLIAAAFFAGFFFYSNKEETFVVNYYYEGPYQIEIQNGLVSWHTDTFKFKQVSNIEEAYLIISHVNPSYISNPKWVAQYNHRNKTIYINNKYDRILKGSDLSGVVAHEAGHFIGLEHNLEGNSIMNNKTPYDTTPSSRDKERAANQIRILYYKKFIDEKIFSK